MKKKCVEHFDACDCRQLRFDRLESALRLIRMSTTLSHDSETNIETLKLINELAASSLDLLHD